MILLESVSLKGFMSHIETCISFDAEERLLLDGEVGAGKSSIIEAIIWALYGKSRVDNRSLVHFDLKTASVTLIVKNGDTRFKIVRTTGRDGTGSLDVFTSDGGNFKKLPVSGKRNLQGWIEQELLSSPYDLFVNSVAYPQHQKEAFVSLPASKRKELLLQMSGLEDLSSYYKKANDELKIRKGSIESLESEKKIVDEAISSVLPLNEKIQEEQNLIASIESEIAENKTILEEKKAIIAPILSKKIIFHSLMERSEKHKSLVVSIENRIEEITSKLSTRFSQDDLNSVQAEIDSIETEIQRLQSSHLEFIAIDSEIRSLMGSRPSEIAYEESIDLTREELKKVKDECTSKCILGDECKNHKELILSKTSYLNELIKDRTELLKVQNERLASYQTSLASLIEKREKFSNTEQRLIELNGKKTELLSIRNVMMGSVSTLKEVSELEMKRQSMLEVIHGLDLEMEDLRTFFSGNDFSSIENDIRSIESKLRELETKIRESVAHVGEMKGKTSHLEEMVKRSSSIEEELKKKSHEVVQLGFLKEAFGPDGIQAMAIDLLLPRIEEKTNEVLSQLSGFSVSFQTQKETLVDGSMKEGLFINIMNQYGHEMEFSSFSGGERLEVIIAISEAFASIQKSGFRLIDELFVGLDESSISSFVETLKKIQEGFKQIVCISHLREVKDEFDHRIYIENKNGESVIRGDK